MALLAMAGVVYGIRVPLAVADAGGEADCGIPEL